MLLSLDNGDNMPHIERFDTACPATGEPCPNRELLVKDYTSNHDNPDLDDDSIARDHFKLDIKLREQRMWAKIGGCEGTEDETCPTRDQMSDSRIRKGLVATVRSLIHRS